MTHRIPPRDLQAGLQKSSTLFFFFFSECGAKGQKRGEHLGYEGIYDPAEGEEQESLQLAPRTLAAVSVSVPVSRPMFIARVPGYRVCETASLFNSHNRDLCPNITGHVGHLAALEEVTEAQLHSHTSGKLPEAELK